MELVERLRAALDATERLARLVEYSGPGGSRLLLQTIAAHRKILDLLPAVRALQERVGEEWDPGEPVPDGEAEAILAALAEAYGVEA